MSVRKQRDPRRPELDWTSDGKGNYTAQSGPYKASFRKESPQHVARVRAEPRFGWVGSGVAGDYFGTLREVKVGCEQLLAELNRGEDPLRQIRDRIGEPFVAAQAVAVIGCDQHPADAEAGA